MKTPTGFGQSYNAQVAVYVTYRPIVGERVSQAPKDMQQLTSSFAAIVPLVGPVNAVLTDSSYCSQDAVHAIEQALTGEASGKLVHAPLERTKHHRGGADLEKNRCRQLLQRRSGCRSGCAIA